MVGHKTIERIDEIVSRIKTHPEYSSQVMVEATVALYKEAAKHSYSLEVEGEIEGRRQSEQEEKEALLQIKEGWQHLKRYGISVSSLAPLGHLIAPKKHTAPYFRNELIQFGPFFAPDQEKVPQLVDNLVFRLGLNNIHPVIRATEAHIELVRIHPYMDGNGRSARLVQNFYLHKEGYPAAIIPSSERELYISLMEDTLRDRDNIRSRFECPSKQEELLQEYFASKILSSVRRLEDELKKRRRFTVVVNKIVDRGVVKSLSGMIRSHAKAHGRGVAVQSDRTINSRKGTGFSVMGDVGIEELREVMDRCKAKYNFSSYEVHSRTD